MKKLITYFKHKPHFLILIIILALGTFFRTYAVISRFDFAHDGDLYSWFVKDVVVNHHTRLIGQLTSAPGIFIGPLYYYLNIPFFLLTNMDPIGAIIPIVIIGVLTVLSYYWVFAKLFNIKIGLIASFLYAILLETIQLDRRVVPSTPTNLWVIWYFYTLISLVRGNFNVLPILGVLIGLIWHIHIALVPPLLAVPTAILLSGKIPKLKQLLNFFIISVLTSLPLLIFEIRHNFVQTISLFKNFGAGSETAGSSGLYKIELVLEMITKNINTLFFAPQSFEFTKNIFFVLIFLLSLFFLVKKKIFTNKEVVVFYIWILGVVVFFSLSSSPISEYYFFNIEIIFIAIVSALFYLLFKSSKIMSVAVILILSGVALKNAHYIITRDYYHKGYNERKAVVEYIVSDAKEKNLKCFAITYITTPGENVGFRYFFYLKNAHIVKYSEGSPVYNIVIPDEYSKGVEVKFGHIGIETPKDIPLKNNAEKICAQPNINLSDPMFGFVQ